MKIAIIGGGNVGSTLGKRLLHKHEIKYGVRDTASPKNKELLVAQPSATVDTVEAALSWAEAVILATPGVYKDDAKMHALAESLKPGVNGKVVIDTTNPLSPWPHLDLPWEGKSAGEQLQELLPEATVYKAFNSIGVEHMASPDGSQVTGEQLTMFYCGGPAHKETAEQVVADVGFKPVYCGPIRYARNLEAIAELWIHLSVPGLQNGTPYLGRNIHTQFISK